jgi:hypothetical protein
MQGFIGINSNAGTLELASEPYMWLWGLAALYFVIAVIVEKLCIRHDLRRYSK